MLAKIICDVLNITTKDFVDPNNLERYFVTFMQQDMINTIYIDIYVYNIYIYIYINYAKAVCWRAPLPVVPCRSDLE